MNREIFYQGKTVDEFLASFKDNRAKFESLLSESVLDEKNCEMLTALSGINYVQVIAEPWSGDVLYYLPPFLRMAEAAKWDVRIFPRDQYPDMIINYRKEGLYHSIPVIIFYDKDFIELAHWIERPGIATKVLDEEGLKLRRRLREENKEAWRDATISEIMDLLKSIT